MPERYLGSAYSLIFWVQNVGLCLVPYLIGVVLNSTNPGVSDAFKNKNELETLNDKIEYIDQINKLEATIPSYETLKAEVDAQIGEIDAQLAAIETNNEAEGNDTVDTTQDASAEAEAIKATLIGEKEKFSMTSTALGYYIADSKQELKNMKKDKATQGISKDFNYDKAVADRDKLLAKKAEKGYVDNPRYDYTATMLLFVSFGVLALLFGFWLKIEDKRKGYGLELPNIKK
jgi:hypothetical protein